MLRHWSCWHRPDSPQLQQWHKEVNLCQPKPPSPSAAPPCHLEVKLYQPKPPSPSAPPCRLEMKSYQSKTPSPSAPPCRLEMKSYQSKTPSPSALPHCVVSGVTFMLVLWTLSAASSISRLSICILRPYIMWILVQQEVNRYLYLKYRQRHACAFSTGPRGLNPSCIGFYPIHSLL